MYQQVTGQHDRAGAARAERKTAMYNSHITQELARARINDHLARAEAHRLTAAAKRHRRLRRGRTVIPATVRVRFPRFMARRPAT
jgi:hypothetical protein